MVGPMMALTILAAFLSGSKVPRRLFQHRNSAGLVQALGLVSRPGACTTGGLGVANEANMDTNNSSVVIHLNHAGASPSPARVTACLSKHQAAEQKLGGYRAAAQAQDALSTVYRKAAELVHAADPAEIALVESATVGWTRLFYSFAAAKERQRLKEGNNRSKRQFILMSEAEYAANVVAACEWVQSHADGAWSVLAIPSGTNEDGTSTGKVDLTVLQQMLEGTYQYNNGEEAALLDPSSIAIVCITHIPTNSGIVNPAEEIGAMIAKFNTDKKQQRGSEELPSALYLLDSCQSIGQRVVSAPEIQCHGLVATGRKYLRGPRGTGFLYLPLELANAIRPHHVDHFGLPVQRVPQDLSSSLMLQRPVEQVLECEPLRGARRFEFWESNIASRLALGEALDEALSVGMDKIRTTILERVHSLSDKLRRVSGVESYYPSECGICTFAVTGESDPTWVKEQLWGESNQLHFEVSVVPATSTPLDSARTGVSNLLRASVSYTNTDKELEMFCQRLSEVLQKPKLQRH